jgi:cytosine/adenosine deaminase-related metal-dependent hydrolase
MSVATVDAGDAEIVDVRGRVVMPGFVDTHRHTWQTAFREWRQIGRTAA